ncbi:MAG: TRAP transporter substrate-binding protein [Acetobacteraceae bacterium]
MTTRRILLAGTAGLLAAPAIIGTARAQTRTLRIGNWLPLHHLIPRGILEPWARAIEAETNGSLRFEIMPSALGPPPAQFDLMLDGAFDVGYGVSGHNPGRFTMTQVIDLPFMSPDPWAGAAASWLTYQRYGARYNEHRGAHVAGLFVHSTPSLHWRGEPITRLEEMQGRRVRVGGNVTGRIIQAMGGTPVQLPPTEAQQAMSRGVADGITFPIESIAFFNITPVIRSTTLIPGGLYTDTFWVAFNERSWNGLTDAQKAAVNKHSGLGIALQAGWAWTMGDRVGQRGLEERNVRFNTLAAEEVTKIRERLSVLETEWLAEAQRRNLPGQEIIAYARRMAQLYAAERRVNVP